VGDGKSGRSEGEKLKKPYLTNLFRLDRGGSLFDGGQSLFNESRELE